MKKIIVLFFAMLFLVVGCSTDKEERKIISYEDVNSIIEDYKNFDNVYIIDVREESEYKEGHLNNAYNIPLSELIEIENKNISFDSKIIVYCKSGNRSKIAQEKLIELGYNNVYDMGGIINWLYDVVGEN